MKSFNPEYLLRDIYKPMAKKIKAKSSYCCIYKKDGEYFWRIDHVVYSEYEERFGIYIKPCMYDELHFSIVRPDEEPYFPDRMRHGGFFAMDSYQIAEKYYPSPGGRNFYEINPDDSNEDLVEWCQRTFDESVKTIIDFINMVKTEYGDFNQFHIVNADECPLTAAYAHIARQEYGMALPLLKRAAEKGLKFSRCYGLNMRDLRDVLIDYCEARLSGTRWTRQMVVGT